MNGWEWRKGTGGWVHNLNGPGYQFHAAATHDHHLACTPALVVAASDSEPNEGSRFCPVCMDIVRTIPARDL